MKKKFPKTSDIKRPIKESEIVEKKKVKSNVRRTWVILFIKR